MNKPTQSVKVAAMIIAVIFAILFSGAMVGAGVRLMVDCTWGG